MQPLVSIIINCHNGDMCIRLYKLCQFTNIQKLGNYFGIMPQKKSIINKLSKNDKIKYYYSKTFTSLGEARNLAIQKAKGEYLAFLDIDDTWEKTKIRRTN